MINTHLMEYARNCNAGEEVNEVLVGPSSVLVILDNGKCAMAMHYLRVNSSSCAAAKGFEEIDYPSLSVQLNGKWQGKSAVQLISCLGNGDKLDESAAVACVNALCSDYTGSVRIADFVDALDLNPDSEAAIVGYFYPIIERLRERVKKLYIFELIEHPDFLPVTMEDEIFPRCDAIICTGTTLVNSTFDDVNLKVTTGQQFILTGPTVPIIPDVFKHTNVSVLAGSQVIDAAGMKQGFLNGLHGRNLRPFMQKKMHRLR
ncbi:DUF364 domain-containing protein [Myxococcota bacterium]|nr:DUF364 domain-containing protein [Myxococcota bacterium]MBU1379443.1 DUF364 domain-containing protein [Myxococcota bacterium]MBU1498194.1 DUF364 domain-containing protein [Myxococcota bacterium]